MRKLDTYWDQISLHLVPKTIDEIRNSILKKKHLGKSKIKK